MPSSSHGEEAEQPLPLSHARAVPVSIAPGTCLAGSCCTGSCRPINAHSIAVELDLEALLADSCGRAVDASSSQQADGARKYKLLSSARGASHAQVPVDLHCCATFAHRKLPTTEPHLLQGGMEQGATCITAAANLTRFRTTQLAYDLPGAGPT